MSIEPAQARRGSQRVVFATTNAPVNETEAPSLSRVESSSTRSDIRATIMPEETAVRTSDEITPIRQAANSSTRNYNTAESTDPASQANNEPATTDEQTNKPSTEIGLWKKISRKYGSISLENKGSVARDHLALERTFLAWLRTSLAFASIGIAITQLFRLNTSISNRSRVFDTARPLVRSHMPLSLLQGHDVPADVEAYLQSVLGPSESVSVQPNAPEPVLGPTLLDQLLLLSPDGTPVGTTWSEGEDFHQADSDAKIRHLGKPLGATFIGISIIVLLVGFHRYFEAQYWIIRGKFPASRGSIALVGVVAGALIVASLVVVTVVSPTQYEKRK